ncbi:MAG: YqgE/AlgH family protein [Proteobacteria bacterium]|nr:YqgE/AlgH family protein [Pseudomonadota bacterium]
MVESQIAPGFLVASPQLKDPNFENTVILMLEHDDEEGALGLVINRKANVELDTVLSEMRLDIPNVVVDIDKHPPLLCGGPVSPERGWILHTPDWSGPETRPVSEGLSVTSSLDILQSIIAGDGPRKYRFYLGYSGWGPHQLVGEIKTGAWINVPYSVDLVFDVPLEKMWMTSFDRLGIDPIKLVAIVGDA